MFHRRTWIYNRYVPGGSGERNLYFEEDAVVGSSAIEALGRNDVVFEYEVTSNRVDCFSVVGIAREAAATFRKEFCPPVVAETGNDEDVNDYIKVTVENTELCPRYCARVVKNVKLDHLRDGCKEDWLLLESVRSTILLISQTM